MRQASYNVVISGVSRAICDRNLIPEGDLDRSNLTLLRRDAKPIEVSGPTAEKLRNDLTRAIQAKIGRARDQLLIFIDHPGQVEPTNNGLERRLRPSVVQRKMTNGYRAMWAVKGEAHIRTVVDPARLNGSSPFGTILKTIGP